MSIVLALWLWQSVQEGQVQLDYITCQVAGRSLLIACLAFDVVAVIIGVLLKWFWDRRHVWNPAARLGVSLLVTIGVSTALVAWNPVKNEALLDCIADPAMSREILMAHVSDAARGLVLGGAIAATLYFVVVIVMGLLSKKRAS